MAAAELTTARATAGGTDTDGGAEDDDAEAAWRAVVKGPLLSAAGRVISRVAARSASDICIVLGFIMRHRLKWRSE